jgi:ParB/RepB/Spo0J family partition protein
MTERELGTEVLAEGNAPPEDNSSAEPENGEPDGSAAEPEESKTKKKKSNGKPPRGKVNKKVKSTDDKPTFAVQMIPTESLCVLHPDREGNEEGTEAFENLRTNIRKVGILQPPLVYFDEKRQKWVVVDGKRRFAIAKLEGIAKVPCHVIRSKMSKGQEFLLAASGNAHRKDLTPWEWAHLFQRILQATQQEQAEVAEAYGFSKSVVTEYLKLLDPRVKGLLSEEQFEALKAGKFSAKSVSRQITALDSPKKRTRPTNGKAGGESSPEQSCAVTVDFAYETWPDAETNITLVARGKAEKHPSIDRVITAVGNWLRALSSQSQNATNQSSTAEEEGLPPLLTKGA